ncbi:hypothetical protein NLI96_g5907 [Meripilus lineatus]|uniref:Uncharacterized protein n=1 Tax=Meripilus lineatus TaxID=2056292 RepID=A0AAD5V2Q6_9APHY|nr:hypothetical protein NLI96_g5907 [Physisporinus lineatus]
MSQEKETDKNSDARFTQSPVDSGIEGDGALLTPERRPLAERRLVRMLDMRLLPVIFLIFIISLIDRTATTAARLTGLQEDIHLTDIQYSTVLAILYVSFVPAQIPSNLYLNRTPRPSLYIPACVVTWGLVSCLTGLVNDYAGLLAARIFLGIPEAAFNPGTMYLLSRWYTRRVSDPLSSQIASTDLEVGIGYQELAFRSALLYSGFLLSNAFGSLMAAGILSGMEGKRGIRAWRWCLLPDYPHNTVWLTPAERRLAQVRLAEDVGEADQNLMEDSIETRAHRPKGAPIFADDLFSVPRIKFSYSILSISLTLTLGYSRTISLLLAAFVGHSLILVWVSNTIPRPPVKRSASIAIVSGCGNLGTLMGSYAWKSRWGPDYHPSMYIGLASLVLCITLAYLVRLAIVKHNVKLLSLEYSDAQTFQRTKRERIEIAARLEGATFEEVLEKNREFSHDAEYNKCPLAINLFTCALRDTLLQTTFAMSEEKQSEGDIHLPHDSAKNEPDGILLSPDRRPLAEQQLVRMLDMRLLPAIILIFIMNYIDRTAVTAARLKGLQQDLHVTDIEYSTVLAVLYASYIPAQIPSNMILNRISRPSYYIPACVILWGLISCLTGVRNSLPSCL